jgi:CRP/FNR family transcriptional regulator
MAESFRPGGAVDSLVVAQVPGSTVRAAPQAQVACSVCAFNALCHSRAAAAGAPSLVEVRRRIPAGELLYRTGAPHESIYAVRAGFLKICAPGVGDESQVVRFLLPGDVAGLDGYAGGEHARDAVALGGCEVCEIPAYRAEILSDFNPRIGAQLRRLLAQELVASQAYAATLALLGVHQRIGRFLVDLGRRWRERGYSATSFLLPMSRRDIANHLALTPETLSRTLAAFQARGWIRLKGRELDLLAPDALAAAELR